MNSNQLILEWEKQRNKVLQWLETHGVTKSDNKLQKMAFQTTAKSLKDLKIAAIMDRFTLDSYAPECHLLELTPQHWKEEIDTFHPDLLFIESAWKGKDDLWYHKVDRYSQELFDLTSYVRELNIPIIFWNKEDPVYTDIFMLTAGYADVVFTTDIDCIARYKAELGHERVYHLHFAAQPTVHNPIEKFQRKDKFCFAGAYYHKYQERARVFDSFAKRFLGGNGLDIYDRNYPNALPEHAFPKEYQPYILGSLPSSEIDTAYKGYTYGVNMNSIQQSQTMFARRVFELLASNTVVVGNYSRGVKNYFGDLTVSTDDDGTLDLYLNRYCSDKTTREKYRLLGLRKVLSAHLYRNRLAYICEKVFGKNLLPSPPHITVLANAETQEQANHLEAMFLSQTIANLRLILIGAVSDEQKQRYICYSREEFNSKSIKDICRDGLVSWWEGADWYGPNYLLDLSLTWNYGEYRAAGKTAYYQGPDFNLHNPDTSYRKADSLTFRRAMIKAEELSGVSTTSLSGTWAITGDDLMSTDHFQYCEHWAENSCPAAEDLFVADQGIPIERIIRSAEGIHALEEAGDVLRITGEMLAKSTPPERIPVTYEAEGSKLLIQSNLEDGKHEYIYNKDIRVEVDSWIQDGKLPVQFRGMGSLDLICVLICYDKNGKKLGPLYPKLNRREMLQLPKETDYVEIGFRPKGKGSSTIRDIMFGGSTEIVERSSFLSRSNVLVLSNHYPAPNDLYRNMFVHKRLLAYRDSGRVYDVLRMNPYAQNGYREYEGINIVEGHGNDLVGILESDSVNLICVHFLDAEMWSVLKNYLGKIRLIIWSHGADIQPWWRRKFNYNTDAELEHAKQLTEDRMEMWQEVFEASQTSQIHFVFVSEYAASEVMEDYNIQLDRNKYSIIHNMIDTDLFVYEEKESSQRYNILTIKSFSTKTYANDLTAKAIMELSKRPFFNHLTFTICGEGVLFDKTTLPLKEFKNVKLRRGFLTQKEIANLHKENGIFIATTRSDTQGVSRGEAMSSGLVPIANNCTAVPEFMDDSCGILVPPENYVAVADAVERLYKAPDLFKRLSAAAAERVRHQTSKEFTIVKEVELIERQI